MQKATMNGLFYVTLSGLLMMGVPGIAPAEGSPGHKHGKPQKARAAGADAGISRHVAFSQREVQVIREYYAPKYRSLPPGLQKKLYRTGRLPPGWQKKFEPFPVVLERRLVLLPSGYRRGVVDGHAVVFDPRTRMIVDVAALFF
jgi:hypothetical protein